MALLIGRQGFSVLGVVLLLLLLLLLPLTFSAALVLAQDGQLGGGTAPDSASVERWLDERRVSLALDDVSLRDGLWQLSRASSLNLALHPAAAELSQPVTLKLTDVPVRSLLDAMLSLSAPASGNSAGSEGGGSSQGAGAVLTWRLVGTVIFVEPAVFTLRSTYGGAALLGVPPDVQGLLDRRVNVKFDKAPAEEAVDFLRKTASLPIVIDGLLLTHWRTSNSTISLSVRDVEVRVLVDLMSELLGLQARWQNSSVMLSLPQRGGVGGN